jgi:lysophospholipase L1-like esterase
MRYPFFGGIKLLKKTFCLFLCAVLLACGGVNSESVKESPSKKIVISCIGDSVTEGWQDIAGKVVRTPETSYPEYLEKITGYKVNNHGVGGKTSSEIYGEQFQIALSERPDAIIITSGVNDIIHGISIGRYISNNVEMITKARSAGVKVFILTSISWEPITETINKFNEAILLEAAKSGAVVIDIRRVENRSWICSSFDQHPCANGYYDIAKLVASELKF